MLTSHDFTSVLVNDVLDTSCDFSLIDTHATNSMSRLSTIKDLVRVIIDKTNIKKLAINRDALNITVCGSIRTIQGRKCLQML